MRSSFSANCLKVLYLQGKHMEGLWGEVLLQSQLFGSTEPALVMTDRHMGGLPSAFLLQG